MSESVTNVCNGCNEVDPANTNPASGIQEDTRCLVQTGHVQAHVAHWNGLVNTARAHEGAGGRRKNR
jgi:hypothetical protein